jgi:acetylornithine deacetylase/succinyl-diaminopimelate desuccinylase-like protein
MKDEQVEAIHGINEYVEVESLAPAVDFYKYVIKEV